MSRAAADLSAGFIAPVADGRSGDLAVRQDQVMETVRRSVAAQSEALSAAAAEILAQPKVAERRFVPLSSAEAVLLYATSFLPSWAGAISIDLLPAVLVGVMVVVFGAIRRGEDELDDAGRITAADMMRSLDLHEALLRKQAAARREQAIVEDHDAAEAEEASGPPDPPVRENVTALSLTERKRGDQL